MQINGKECKLVINLNTLAEFEEVTGKNALQLGDLGAKDYRALAWVAIKQGGNPDVTLEEAGSINISDISAALVKSMPNAVEGK